MAHNSYPGAILCETALSPNSPPVDAEKACTNLCAFHRLESSKEPYFVKEVLRDVHKQMKERKAGEVITIKTLDGLLVDFKVRTGEILDISEGVAWIAGKTYIEYVPIHTLASNEAHGPYLGYCNLLIIHRLRFRAVRSGEYLHEPVLPPFEACLAEFFSFRQVWEASDTHKQIRATLEALPAIATPITKIIGFACNSLANPQGCMREKQRVAFQHALLLTLKDHLDTKTGNPDIKILVQDPAYTEADIAMLTHLGMTVVEDPVGFVEVDEQSFVFACSPTVPARQIVMDMAMPAGMVWNKVLAEAVIFDVSDPWNLSVHRCINRYYDTHALPEDRKHFALMALYVRRVEGEVSAEVYAIRDLEVLITVRNYGQYADQMRLKAETMYELLCKVDRFE
ncbi:SRR1 family protein [Aspergillus ibericus CBS 121593]|uniref:SRR1-like domain-containing protein n=1 Tax=Aspergillus ibericus CBS 121593 TaxID=1448316 RepID=A0A395HA83_9EURO|nr:hypothetical protein BO80DRAFT_485094 [Aspergillus ibericus CBS 121593]RAL04489.1 hypothetical protein BO80DRAFT_485094 [Aspergillus ibericus CBS 121593]